MAGNARTWFTPKQKAELWETANSIATLVSTRMLRPRYAVIWAAFFNFVAFLVFGVHVARTVGVGIVSADVRFCEPAISPLCVSAWRRASIYPKIRPCGLSGLRP